jgi:hypothetical protein
MREIRSTKNKSLAADHADFADCLELMRAICEIRGGF